MTFEAIVRATDEQLKCNLHLTKLGHRLSVRAFSENRIQARHSNMGANNEARKKRLIEELAKKQLKKRHHQSSRNNIARNNEGSSSTPSVSLSRNKKCTRKVELGWLHNSSGGDNNFKLVRLKEGGGVRLVDIPKSASKDEIIQIGQELFFPGGKCNFGSTNEMEVDLFTFKKEKVSTFLDDREVQLEFTLGSYIDSFKLSKVRLYLSTTVTQHDDDNTELLQNHSDYDDEFDRFSEHSPFGDAEALCTEQQNGNMVSSEHQDGLIGSTKEREQLKNLIDEAYQESLAIDQAKLVTSCVEEEETHLNSEKDNSQDELRTVRADRLPREPNVSDPHYIVSVRHLSLGVVTRMFSLEDFMFSVYDWIGSLQNSPKYFNLCGYSGGCLSPSESVKAADKCMLIMVENDLPVVFSPNNCEVIPKGFGPLSSKAGLEDAVTLDPISERCPLNIMEDDAKEEENCMENSKDDWMKDADCYCDM